MNRSKVLPKLILLITIGILIVNFIPAVAASQGKTTRRPLNHWTYWNPFVIFPPAWSGYEPGPAPPVFEDGWYGIFFSFWWYDPPNAPVIPDPLTYNGYIEERELISGGAEITVYIHFQDWKILYIRAFPDPHPALCDYNLNIFTKDLTMSGNAIIKFIFYSPDEWPYPYFPNMYYMLDYELGELVSLSITANGFGTLSDHAAAHGYTSGATAKVTLVQRALGKPAIQEYPGNFGMWPAEIINIQEL